MWFNIHSSIIEKRKASNKRHYNGVRKIQRAYALSGVYLECGSSQYHVCKNAFKLVFNIGTYYIERIEKTVKDGKLIPSLHKLCGKVDNAILDTGVKASVIVYLE